MAASEEDRLPLSIGRSLVWRWKCADSSTASIHGTLTPPVG